MEHSMAATELKAQARTGVGKGAARALRRQGLIPAVIYGDKKSPLPVTISFNEAMKHPCRRLPPTSLRSMSTVRSTRSSRATISSILSDTALHVDFLRIGAVRGSTSVHVTFINEEASLGIKRGGVLNIVHHTPEPNCPADAISITSPST
jgi:large subunit ribosomal protein L25